METFRGEIYLTDSPAYFYPIPPPQRAWIDWDGNQLLGFGLIYSARNGTLMCVPMWVVIAGELSLIAWWMQHPWRRKRNRSGHCVTCNYDLRGSLDRCPECGTPFGSALVVKPPPPARFTV